MYQRIIDKIIENDRQKSKESKRDEERDKKFKSYTRNIFKLDRTKLNN